MSNLRRVQLVAESVAALCPYCGEAQPSPDGSEQWLAEDFIKKTGVFTCVSCDKKILIASDTKAQFPQGRSS